MSAKPEIDLDVVGKLEILNEEVQRILNLVSAGLSRKRDETIKATGLPGIPFRLHPAWYEQDELDEVEEHLDRWLVACGFRDLIESCGRFLEGIRDVLSAVQLVASRADSEALVAWFERELREQKRFHKYGFPKKIEKLCEQLGVARLSSLQQSLLIVNKTRNCLVHRNGRVSEAHDGPGPLVMEWLAVRLEKYGPEGNTQVSSEEDIRGGGIVLVCTNPRRREFVAGQLVSLNARDFNEVCFTAYAFGKTVVELSFAYIDALGIQAAEELNREWRRSCPIGLSLQRSGNDAPTKNTLVALEWEEGSLRIG